MSQIKNKNQEFVKTNHNGEDKANSHQFGYWKSLKDISSTDDYDKYLKQSEHHEDSNVSRRNFISLVAASVALAGLEGCKKPVQKIIPYVDAEIGTIPGIPKYYASTMPFKNNAIGVLIENHDERPVKVEGNEKHPTSLGKSNTFSQATVLDMYDPDRARGVKLDGKKVAWSDYVKYAQSIHDSNGEGLAVLLQESSSPTLNVLRDDFAKTYPNADWVVYDPINNENLYLGIEKAFGKKMQPSLTCIYLKIIIRHLHLYFILASAYLILYCQMIIALNMNVFNYMTSAREATVGLARQYFNPTALSRRERR